MQYLSPTVAIDEQDYRPIAQAIEAYCAAHHKFTFDPSNPTVRLHEPTIGPEEINAALEVLLSTKLTMGPKVRAFEDQFAQSICGRPDASDPVRPAEGVSCNSGSSANLLAISAMVGAGYLKPGDEVIVSALSWSTTIWPLIQHGLVPVLVDIDPRTFNMDPYQVQKARKKNAKIKAIMPVHVYGNPCDIDELATIGGTGRHIIEDCCEAFGAFHHDGAPVGSKGRIASYSFYLSHHITTGGEGGMAVTADIDLAERMRILRAHGWIRDLKSKSFYTEHYPDIDPKFMFVGLGYNLRMTELQAAIGALQVPKLAGYVATRRENNAAYRAALSKYDFMRFQEELPGARSSCFDLAIVLTPDAPFTVSELAAYLEYQKIETRPVIAGNMAQQPGMRLQRHRVVGKLPHASHILTHGISIGNHHHVNAEARDYVVSKIDEFVAQR